MSMVRLDPFGDLVSLREAMNRLLEESFVRPSSSGTPEALGARPMPIDMYQTENEVVVKAPMPGVKADNVDVSITDDVLTISGETKLHSEAKREDYIVQERRYGKFYRQVALPTMVEADKAQANFEDGVLTLTLPKAERVKPRAIKVTAKAEK
jgi:HSP20 family protein